ncbi:gluconokinase [Microbacterium sp. 1.5R]|uniref:gluconokinase n=1 Tax=Microbacterium sp. 1.5R TaxID=1916917 RepID=UPI0011A98B17|nr:gluconokinase [Microbacterium sp. 1.5R]
MGIDHVVVMGVSGVGKSSVGPRLASHLGWTFADADDFHPAANIAKMSAGIPLTTADRAPWLETVRAWMAEAAPGTGTVVACSALRREYRNVLSSAGSEVLFVHLHADAETLRRRMQQRDHFMPTDLLDSQIADLEPLHESETGLTVDAADDLETVLVNLFNRIDTRTTTPEMQVNA